VILSAGLTPAWQQILVFDGFRCGEVNRAAEVHWCASGKVFNAGIAAHHLGGPSLTLATAGGPPLDRIRDELNALGVPCRLITTAGTTRVCTTLLDRSTGTMTELVEEGRPLAPGELDAYRAAYAEEASRASVVVLIGSLPKGTDPSLYRELLARTPCPVVLDFRGEGLRGALGLEPLVVKPNREELAATVGRRLETDGDLLQAMRSLVDAGAEWVLVTDGSRPCWLVGTAAAYRFHPVPVEKPVNPIGCGDAMAAAIAWAVRDGRSMVDAAKLAVAAAAENLTQLFPCRLDPDRVQRLAEAVRVERLTM
jgi:tagatose 6-phosphate kinase